MTEKNTTTEKKTETKAETKTPHATAMFGKMAEENTARLESMRGEWEKMQQKGIEQAHVAVDEYARLMKDSMNYATRLGAEWQKLALASSKQAMGMFQGTTPWQV